RVGVTVEVRRTAHGLEHARQRLEGVLVARQLEAVGRRRLALAVRRQRRDLGPDAGKNGFGTHPSILCRARNPLDSARESVRRRAPDATLAGWASSSARSSTASPSG